jgi:hypothetical protein
MRAFAFSSLASILMLGLALQTATPPRHENPHAFPSTESETTVDCGGVVEYTETLFATISDHAEFSEYWRNGDYSTIQQQDPEDIQDIVDDGNALLEEMETMDVPETYKPGHAGIMELFGYDIGYITFMGIDASTVPNGETWDRGLALVLEGELGTSTACPDEIEEVGGFIFFPIDDLEDALE